MTVVRACTTGFTHRDPPLADGTGPVLLVSLTVIHHWHMVPALYCLRASNPGTVSRPLEPAGAVITCTKLG